MGCIFGAKLDKSASVNQFTENKDNSKYE